MKLADNDSPMLVDGCGAFNLWYIPSASPDAYWERWWCFHREVKANEIEAEIIKSKAHKNWLMPEPDVMYCYECEKKKKEKSD